ncbi:hypothetical protein ACE418_13325 [Megasphaera sp. WILCCON 0056]|uniref:hypothetical protein n=1 Tax=Megasphaera sp. WILCCON 0056 TaxID=3345340 RepID=UPI003A7FDA57
MDLAKRQSVNKYFLYMGFIVVLLLTALSLGGCGQSYDKHVQMVRNGTMQISPNVQVGPAFDQFFADGKWEYFKATDNSQVVQFTGECTWENKPAKAKIQFILKNDKSFELGHVDINGVSLNKLESLAMVKKVLNSYHKKK